MAVLNYSRSIVYFFILFFLHVSLPAQIKVNINSGNPVFPFPQFLPYNNPTETLHNLGTRNSVGVTHAEMEQTIRDAYQIMMNRAEKPGGGVGGIDYIYFNSAPSCTEGDGYAMLAAVAMADKETFDGLWLWVHDHAMNKVKRYNDCKESSPEYEYSQLPGWTNTAGDNSAADADFDIGFALLCAYYQWGEFMGIDDACGNPISYKKAAIDFIKAITDTIPYRSNSYVSGDIGLDGYFKGGDSWSELTGSAQHIDYAAPGYFRAFAEFLAQEDSSRYAWNIYQFRRAEASCDWLLGQLLPNEKMIPFAGWVELDENNVAIFSNFSDGEDFRMAWRTILNSLWHGNPDYTWNPETHQIQLNEKNSFETDIGKRYARFLWDSRQSPWNNPCISNVGDESSTCWGPDILKYYYTPEGEPQGTFALNWIHGTGSPSAVISQNFDLMAEMFRKCEINWDATTPGDGYLTSTPFYFHGWFRLLGMLVLSGNYHAPSQMNPSANMKVYLDVDRTYASEGDTLTYYIQYRNYGSIDAQNVIITDTLDNDFRFISCTGAGIFNSSSRTVEWNIGTVSGFRSSTGIEPTSGELILKVVLESAQKKQYANRVSISCSNGSGWISNEFPDRISSIMKRNFVDVKVNDSDKQDGRLNVSSLHGGRSGVHFSCFQHDTIAISPEKTMTVSMFHDANEAYINYGSYRVSCFLFDPERNGIVGQNGNTTGWVVEPVLLEGVSDIKVSHENLSPGSDSRGKWNQRIMIQFTDTLPSDTNWSTMATTYNHLVEFKGIPGCIHRGQTDPLRVTWSISGSDGSPVRWDDDWSWNAVASSNDSGFLGYPVTPDYTDPAPDNKGVSVNRLHPKFCDTAEISVDNILIEEWDGCTWRRIFGGVDDNPVKISKKGIKSSGCLSFVSTNALEVKYKLPVSGNVKLRLLNLQGKEIVTLFDSYQKAGAHRVKWNGIDFGSNIYLLRLDSGNRFLVKKLVLVH